MKHGSVPNCVTTPQDFAALATARGADSAEVHEDVVNTDIEIHVTGMSSEERYRLLQTCRKAKPAGTIVDIVPADDDPDYEIQREWEHDGHDIVLTEDQRLLLDHQDITAEYAGEPISSHTIRKIKDRIGKGELPKDDPIMPEKEFMAVASHINNEDDIGELADLCEKYGGWKELYQAFEDAAVERHESVVSSEESASSPNTESVEEVKQAYVEGEIGDLELENRLEEVIEVEPYP